MGHDGGEIWIRDAAVFLIAAGILIPALRLVRVPTVLGFLLAGVALGPYGLARYAETLPVLRHFTIIDREAAAPFAELGVLFLLFLIGLELSLGRLWRLRRAVFGAGATQALVSALAIGIAGYLAGLRAGSAVAVGLALALSSTAIVMQLMIEQHRAAGPVGRATLSVLLFQDMLVAPILILIGFLAQDTEAGLARVVLWALAQGAAAVAVIFLIGRYALRPAFRMAARAGGRDFLMAVTLLTVVGGGLLTAGAGMSLALGAFLGGLLLGETEFKHQTEVDLEPFKGLLMGVFFMTVGMAIDLDETLRFLPLVLGGLAAMLLLKGIVALAACRLFAGGWRVAIECAFVLAPAGEFAFVVVSTAAAAGVLEGQAATIVVAIAGISMMTTPLLAPLGRRVAQRLAPAAPAGPGVQDYERTEGHVIVAGFGRIGRMIGRFMVEEEADLVALESDAELVARHRPEGWQVYVGDAAQAEILKRAGLAGARIFVVTVDDEEDAARMVHAARALRPDLAIFARARDADHARKLIEAGASYVVPDALEAGLELAERTLRELGNGGEAVRGRIAAEREAEYRRAGLD